MSQPSTAIIAEKPDGASAVRGRGFRVNCAIWSSSPCGLTPVMTLAELQLHERRAVHDRECPFYLPVQQRPAPAWWPVS